MEAQRIPRGGRALILDIMGRGSFRSRGPLQLRLKNALEQISEVLTGDAGNLGVGEPVFAQ